MDPAAKLEAILRLQTVMVAWERGDAATVCAEGEAYLEVPDVHLDLVTRRPEVHAMVGLAWLELEWPAPAGEHLERALLGERHLTVVDPLEARLRAGLSLLLVGRYAGAEALLAPVLERDAEGPAGSRARRLLTELARRRSGDLDAGSAWSHDLAPGAVYAQVQDLLGEAEARAADDPGHAERCWRVALELAEERELRPEQLRAWEVRVRVLTARADATGAARALAVALELADDLGHVGDRRRLEALASGG